MQVESDKIIYNIVSINPTNHEHLDPTSQLGRYLGLLKFGVKKILNTPTVWFKRSIVIIKIIEQYFLLYILFMYDL